MDPTIDTSFWSRADWEAAYEQVNDEAATYLAEIERLRGVVADLEAKLASVDMLCARSPLCTKAVDR